jgi:hypothetical protein
MEEILRRGWEGLIGRPGGPMSFRVILQPAVATVLAVRAGLRDARAGRRPFLWCFFINPHHRRELLRHVWKEVGTVFIIALVLDAIYQLIVHTGVYALELVVTATILAIIPYALVRTLVTLIARRGGSTTQSGPPAGAGRNDRSTEAVGHRPDGSPDGGGDGKRTDTPPPETNTG